MIYVPGDIVLVQDYSGQGDLIGNLILAGSEARYGERLWTHSALIVSENGDIVEAEQRGVERNNIRKYAHRQTYIVNFDAPPDDIRRVFATRFAMAQVGDSYGVVGFISLAVDLLFNLKLGLHVQREPICSELCSQATESMTFNGWGQSPATMMPIDIYAWRTGLQLQHTSFFKRLGLLAQALWKSRP